MEKEIVLKLHKSFEEYSRKDGEMEYWHARDLQKLLGYTQWRNFELAIEKAKIACEKSKQKVSDHFADVSNMVNLGSGSQREVKNIKLTRYACYLIAQNGDPRKNEIAFAQTYFALQTRKQELIEQRLMLQERIQAREKLSLSEKKLSGIIFERGVDGQGFARIRSKGDKELFGGYSTSDMKLKLKIKESRPLADFLPAVTIKAKDFANEITNYNLRKDIKIHGEAKITTEHIKNNREVRKVLVKSGIKPESLPAQEDVKKIAKRLKFESKKIGTKSN